MCGIAGYVGSRSAVDVVFDQLQRLEYRGYDSAGVAFHENGGIKVLKRAGKLDQLQSLIEAERPEANMAMAHSRWATHGAPTDLNAHPHYDQFADIALVHNGIIENYYELKEELVRKGHVFQSETDSEVAAHIIGLEYNEGVSLEEAVRRSLSKLRGAYSFVVISKREPGKIVATRNASPLIVGFGEGENMLASDIPALLNYTRNVAIIDNDLIVTITKDEVKAMNVSGTPVELETFEVDWDIAQAEKGGHAHFMLKEILEQPNVVRDCLAGRISEDNRVVLNDAFTDSVWQEIDRIHIVACGTAYNAGLMGKFIFEKMLRIPTVVCQSSEFRYGDPILSPRSLAIFISQSGETADSLAALRLCKKQRVRTLGVVNVVGSSIARECDRTIFTQAGPEISVASTKAYVGQVLVLYLLGLYIAQVREMPGIDVESRVKNLRAFAEHVQDALELQEVVWEIAKRHKDAPLIFFLGRNADAHVALEAALKMKEVAYMPTQECPAGEMKHGPLALIEPGVVAVMGATDRDVREKLLSNLKEIQARGGHVLAITTREDESIPQVADNTLQIPNTGSTLLDALLSVVPLQMFAYYVALERGCDIDQPRNLAKSVTVE